MKVAKGGPRHPARARSACGRSAAGTQTLQLLNLAVWAKFLAQMKNLVAVFLPSRGADRLLAALLWSAASVPQTLPDNAQVPLVAPARAQVGTLPA